MKKKTDKKDCTCAATQITEAGNYSVFSVIQYSVPDKETTSHFSFVLEFKRNKLFLSKTVVDKYLLQMAIVIAVKSFNIEF